MNKPDFEKEAAEYHNKTRIRSDASGLPYGHYKAGANHVWTTHVEPLLSENKELREANQELVDLCYRAMNCADYVNALTISEIKNELKAFNIPTKSVKE